MEERRRRVVGFLRAGFGQFPLRPIAVGDADCPDTVVQGAEHIVTAIADHHGGGGIAVAVRKCIVQEVGLVRAGSVELRTENGLKKGIEAEMRKNAFCENLRLAGCDEQPHAGGR